MLHAVVTHSVTAGILDLLVLQLSVPQLKERSHNAVIALSSDPYPNAVKEFSVCAYPIM